MKIVNVYKYLGIYLSTRLTFSHALNDMAGCAKKAVAGIFKLFWSLESDLHQYSLSYSMLNSNQCSPMVPKCGDLVTTHRLKEYICVQSNEF